MSVTYEINAPVRAHDVATLYADAGLNRPIDNIPRLATLLQHSNLVVSAWDRGRLVGLARSLTDMRYCCYLSDLAVAREYQRRGIGKELISRTRAELGEEVMILLLAAPAASDYYGPIGFDQVANAWMIPRSR